MKVNGMLDPLDVLNLAARLEQSFNPGGNLPEDCWAWAEEHENIIHELRGLAECALMEEDIDDEQPPQTTEPQS